MSTGYYGLDSINGFNNFLSDHEWCSSKPEVTSLDHFSLDYEMDKNWDILKQALGDEK